MKQACLGLKLSTKQTLKLELLDDMARVVPWSALVSISEPHCPRSEIYRPPFAVETMLRFRHLPERQVLAADMLRLIKHILRAKSLMVRTDAAVDATLISAPSLTKNASGKRRSEMTRTRKGNNWCFGVKAHIGANAHAVPVRNVVTIALNTNKLNLAETPERCMASIRAKVEHAFRVIKRQLICTKGQYRGLAKNTA